MNVFYPAILAGILALSITIAELVTSKYARTYFLVMRSQWIYVYALIYALIAFGVMLLVDTLTENGLIKLEGLGLSNIWVRAIVVGVSVKAFLHIRLFNVTVGSSNVPIGVETLVLVFEPWLLDQLTLDHYNLKAELIGERVKKYPDLTIVRAKINGNLPSEWPKEKKVALSSDVDKAASVEEAMEAALTYLGKRTLDRLFPLP